MRRDDVEHALDALALEVPAPAVDASSLIARGRRRIVRQRVLILGLAAAVIATAAGVGAAANRGDTPRVVAPVPTTSTTTPKPSQSSAPSPLAFASESEGWICGKQTQYTTDDFDYSGAGTKSVTIPEAPSPQNSEVFAQQSLCATLPGGNLWLVRGSSRRYESEIVRIQSGGAETSVIRFAPKPFGRVVSLDFVDADHGWALVQREGATQDDSYITNDLYSTGDGGVNWSRLLADAPIAAPLDFTSTTSGWASARENGSLKTTDDTGITWHGVNVPTKDPRYNDNHVTLSFTKGDVVVAQGPVSTGNFEEPYFAVSTDNGQTWHLRSGPSVDVPRTGPSGFGGADADHWAFGLQNRLFVTDDSGRTWTEQDQFAGLATIIYVARPSVNAMLVSGYGDARQTSTIVLGTTDRGDNWRLLESTSPPMRSDATGVNFPGGLVGCPTRTITPAEPGDPPPGLVAAAFSYISSQGYWEPDAASAVYKVGDNQTGVFGELFSFQLSSCPKDSVANSWVVELHGVSGSGGGGSTPRAEVVLAHYADGWHVFGRYH